MATSSPARAAALVVTTIALLGCAGSGRAPASGPEIVGATTTEGRGYPFGASGGGPYLPLTESATSPEYGFSPDEPILVGFEGPDNGPENSQLYLNALLGPEGQVVQYQRRGSCCPFKTENSELGTGLLDVYDVTYEGLTEPLVLYLNMYDPGSLLIPKGFTARR